MSSFLLSASLTTSANNPGVRTRRGAGYGYDIQEKMRRGQVEEG
jgi:hypothetical protein